MKEKFKKVNFNKFNVFSFDKNYINNVLKYIDENDNKMIYFDNADNENINDINRVIDYIKKNNKNIKLAFIIDDTHANYNFDYDFYDKINDLNYFNIYNFSRNSNDYGISIVSGLEIKKILDELRIAVSDLSSSDLSPFEKLIGCYDIVKSYKMPNIGDDYGDIYTRHLYGSLPYVLSDDFIVCVGYCNMLNFILRECKIKSVMYDDDYKNHEHELCYINLDDEKYDIHGIFKLDPSNDFINYNNSNEMLFKNYDYFCKDLSHQGKTVTELDKFLSKGNLNLNNIKFKFDIESIINSLFPSFSNYSFNKKVKLFFDKYKEQKYKKINEETLINGIINVESFILNKKLTDEDTNKRKYEIYNIRHSNTDKVIKKKM